MIDSCQEGGPGTQDRHKTTEEDGFISVFSEKLLGIVEVAGFQKNIFAVAKDQSAPARSPDQIADVITKNSSRRSTGNHNGYLEMVIDGSEKRGQQEHCFTGERNARTLDHDEEQHCWISQQVESVL